MGIACTSKSSALSKSKSLITSISSSATDDSFFLDSSFSIGTLLSEVYCKTSRRLIFRSLSDFCRCNAKRPEQPAAVVASQRREIEAEAAGHRNLKQHRAASVFPALITALA